MAAPPTTQSAPSSRVALLAESSVRRETPDRTSPVPTSRTRVDREENGRTISQSPSARDASPRASSTQRYRQSSSSVGFTGLLSGHRNVHGAG